MGDRVRRSGARFGERVIKNGRVRWLGSEFRVSVRTLPDLNGRIEPPYEGQLDGLTGTFYTYAPGTNDGVLFLHSFGEEWPGPNCVDGYFVWDRWEKCPDA